MTNELLAEVSILREKVEKYEKAIEDIIEKEREILIKRAHLEGFHEASIMYHKIIEDIKAEILDMQSTKDINNMDLYDLGLHDAMNVIDKHISGKE